METSLWMRQTLRDTPYFSIGSHNDDRRGDSTNVGAFIRSAAGSRESEERDRQIESNKVGDQS